MNQFRLINKNFTDFFSMEIQRNVGQNPPQDKTPSDKPPPPGQNPSLFCMGRTKPPPPSK